MIDRAETNSEEPNPFGAFETIAEILAFLHRKGGEADVRAVLSMSSSDGTGFAPLTREALEEAAADVEAVGLAKVAAIVSEIAADTPTEAEFCPYEEGSLNAQSWHHSLERRQCKRQRQRRLTNGNGIQRTVR